jgi:hypothetical protein
MVPTEPAAETMPKASVRRVGWTTRAAMLAVMPEVVQASAMPISTPARITIGRAPWAVAVSQRPAMNRTQPPSATQRVPCLSARMPAKGWLSPQATCCTEIASAKSEMAIPSSLAAGAWNRPKFCRIPMARVIIRAAPPSMA